MGKDSDNVYGEFFITDGHSYFSFVLDGANCFSAIVGTTEAGK